MIFKVLFKIIKVLLFPVFPLVTIVKYKPLNVVSTNKIDVLPYKEIYLNGFGKFLLDGINRYAKGGGRISSITSK